MLNVAEIFDGKRFNTLGVVGPGGIGKEFVKGVKGAATGRLVHTLFGQSRAKGIGKDYKVAEPGGAIPIQIVPCIIPLIALTQPEPCRKL